jgi:hypothetical protein
MHIDESLLEKVTEKRPVKGRAGLGPIGSLKGSSGEGNMNSPDETVAVPPGAGGGAVERESGVIAVRRLPEQKCLPEESVRGEGGLWSLEDFRHRREDEVFRLFRRKECSLEHESLQPRSARSDPGTGLFMKKGGGIGNLPKNQGRVFRKKRQIKSPEERSPEMGGGGSIPVDPVAVVFFKGMKRMDLSGGLQGQPYVPKGPGAISLRQILLSLPEKTGERPGVGPVLSCQAFGDPSEIGGRDGDEEVERCLVDIGTLVALNVGADPAVRHPGPPARILPEPARGLGGGENISSLCQGASQLCQCAGEGFISGRLGRLFLVGMAGEEEFIGGVFGGVAHEEGRFFRLLTKKQGRRRRGKRRNE